MMTTFQKHIESEVARIAKKSTEKKIYFQTVVEMLGAFSLGEFELISLLPRGLGSRWEARLMNKGGDEIIVMLYEDEHRALFADAYEFYPKYHGI